MYELISNKWIFILVILLITFITYQYILLLKKSRNREDYGRVKVALRLIWAFVIFCGISSFYAEIFCKMLGIPYSNKFEFYSLIALFIVALFSFLIVRTKSNNQSNQEKSVHDENYYKLEKDNAHHSYKESKLEVFLEFIGFATILKRFDIDIFINKKTDDSPLEDVPEVTETNINPSSNDYTITHNNEQHELFENGSEEIDIDIELDDLDSESFIDPDSIFE